MIEMIAALQPLLIGVVLLWAARFKLFSRFAAASARRSALATLVKEERALPAYRVIGGIELTIGAALLLPPVLWLEGLAATGLTVGFLGYLIYAMRAAPESSCGCLSAQRVPVSSRSIVRGALLVLASLLAAAAGESWVTALTERPAAAGLVLLVEALAIVGLSPELDHRWLDPINQLWANLTNPLRGGSGVPLLSSVQQLQQSGTYRRVASLVSSDVLEYWDEQEWRMVVHAARYQGRPATAIFAVPLFRYEPDTVRVALVDDATGVTLISLADVPSAEEPASATAHSGLALGAA